jgi:hypothetical protein
MHDEHGPDEVRFRDLKLLAAPFWLWVVMAYGATICIMWWLAAWIGS